MLPILDQTITTVYAYEFLFPFFFLCAMFQQHVHYGSVRVSIIVVLPYMGSGYAPILANIWRLPEKPRNDWMMVRFGIIDALFSIQQIDTKVSTGTPNPNMWF